MDDNNIIKQIEEDLYKIDTSFKKKEIGLIENVYDGVGMAIGLMNGANGEKVFIHTKDKTIIEGMIMDLREDETGIIILGDYTKISQGDRVELSGEILSVHRGENLLGRVLDGKGEPIDGKEKIDKDKMGVIEKIAPGVIQRQKVNTPLETGIKAIDSLIPIGRGQRELIIGDRNTGKTTIAIDTIINQKGKNVFCIYCAIGQKSSKTSQIVKTLEEKGALDYTIIVNSGAGDPVTEQYIAPYTAVTIGEYFMEQGKDVLIIYDDLTKHAWAYRQLSLILKRPSGREAYPGDIFYLHSRLLERAARLKKEFGGGSISALPIIETQLGDISAFIPTNLISITDGQIYLEPDLFYSGIRPAINIGLSVSRVGSSAQKKAMKKVTGSLKLEMAQYRELAAFSQFGSDLDENTKKILQKGEKLTKIMTQNKYSPMSQENQIISIFAVTSGAVDNIPMDQISIFEKKLHENISSLHRDIIEDIKKKEDLTDETKDKLQKIISKFAENYV